jgi:alkylation response protein AidB-like acyl-CoA dehydrogenase
MIDFSFTEEQNLLRSTVRAVMEKLATPEYCRRLDREQLYPYELYDAWVSAGLLQMPFPEEYGGLGGNVVDVTIIAEELSRKSFDFFTAYSNCIFCGLNLLRKGTEEQRRHWIPKLINGEVKMSVSMSEPDAGSDVGSMRASALREGSDWVINGQKLWATGAGAKDNVINVYVKTDAKSHYRNGISLFLVDNDTPGLTLRKLDMLGRRGVGTYEIFFDNVRVPGDRLVGGENQGWECVLSGLQFERMTIAAGYCGNLQAIVDLAINYAKERRQFGRPIGTFQAIAHMLADMQTEAEAARTLTLYAAWKLASGIDALREITMAKLFASEAHVRLVNVGMQIFGAYGYNMEYEMQRYFRDARASTIGAGSSQMQRDLLANLMGLKVRG